MAKNLKLKNGDFALVDDEDYEYLSQWTWNFYFYKPDNYGFVGRSEWINGQTKSISLHRFVMNAPKGMLVDHKNMNTLDNRKSNLRICTRAENNRNNIKRSSNTTGYKGVYKYKGKSKFFARIQVDGKAIHLGTHNTPEEAARAYNEAALKYHGEFARLNEL